MRTNPSCQQPGKEVKHVKNIESHKALDMPKFLIVRPTIESEKISMEDQKVYWLGVGMLLYLVKHARTDIIKS